MSSDSLTRESNTDRAVWRNLSWILGLGGSIAMLYYEYLWSRFAFRNPTTISFGGWFWTGFAIATPWNLCFACLVQLRGGVRNGTVGRDVCFNIALPLEMAVLSAYWMLAPEIHRLASLGALK